MADLIDRQKIKARFEPWLKVKGYSEGELNMLKAVLYEITIMPSAERHGTWSEDGGELKCSECHSIFFNDIMDMNKDEMPSFCPACGARMDGKQDG